jgi:hypothetical protein
MSLVSGAAFSALDPAAALLERTNHPAEAAEFLTALTKAEPWNLDAKRRLAETQRDSAALTLTATSRAASYATRAAAAKGIRRIGGPPLSGPIRSWTCSPLKRRWAQLRSRIPTPSSRG